jgi:hypothetical protein
MRHLLPISLVCTVVLALALLAGCDATNTPTLDDAADETARIDQLTNETLQEVEQLTRTYDNILANAGKSAGIAYVPPGSNDALADALAEAGPGGIVVLASGDHHESGTVAITHRVVLVGEPGATLLVDTQPMPVVATMARRSWPSGRLTSWWAATGLASTRSASPLIRRTTRVLSIIPSSLLRLPLPCPAWSSSAGHTPWWSPIRFPKPMAPASSSAIGRAS